MHLSWVKCSRVCAALIADELFGIRWRDRAARGKLFHHSQLMRKDLRKVKSLC